MIKLKMSPKVLKAFKKELAGKVLIFDKQMTYLLEAAVAELVNHAKLSAEYQDQTSNLKSSIGGSVYRNGLPITYRGFEKIKAGGEGEEGQLTGIEFLNEKASALGTGYGIILVAGMEYATYVEDVHGRNVLTKTELKATEDLPKLIAQLKSRIK